MPHSDLLKQNHKKRRCGFWKRIISPTMYTFDAPFHRNILESRVVNSNQIEWAEHQIWWRWVLAGWCCVMWTWSGESCLVCKLKTHRCLCDQPHESLGSLEFSWSSKHELSIRDLVRTIHNGVYCASDYAHLFIFRIFYLFLNVINTFYGILFKCYKICESIEFLTSQK